MASRAEAVQGYLLFESTAEQDRQTAATKAVSRKALYPDEWSHLRTHKSCRKKTWRGGKKQVDAIYAVVDHYLCRTRAC